jgi:3-(methylthio)propanoyl-CoA dehydrogenase
MIPFRAPVDDILYTLEHVAGAGRLPGWDSALAAEILSQFAAFAEAEIAPLDSEGDRIGCTLVQGRVQMPPGFAKAYARYVEQGWHLGGLPQAYGGMDLPAPLQAGMTEIFAGACHSLQMLTGLVPGAARTLLRFGSDEQIARLMPALASGATLATMCLTEPDAGSDLAAIRCRARRSDDGQGEGWLIEGEKIFISGGDQDLTADILHLVLARSGEVDSGLHGLSLFLCRNGATWGRNGLSVSRLESKMGLHASPTCQMEFSAAPAELIGAEGEGLRAMFTLMNHARLDVALQGVAHAARASDIAATYAAGRRQGRRADGSPATLSDHADVRRMLADQRRHTLISRALCHLALVELSLGQRPDLVEFLTPLCKIYGSQTGIRSADLGMQILGGYGYLAQYRVEQCYRDARITAIYEGANGIHAQNLATRLLCKPGTSDAFGGFITRLDCTGALAQPLTEWQALAAQVRADPSPDAHGFVRATLALVEQALWPWLSAKA